MSTVAYIVLTAGALAGLATFLVAHYIDRRRWHEWRRRIALNERTRWYSRNPWADDAHSYRTPDAQLWIARTAMGPLGRATVDLTAAFTRASGYLRRTMELVR